MSLEAISAELTGLGVKHKIVTAADFTATAAPIHFKTSSERMKQRKEAKLYRQRNKSKLKLKAKVYRKKMKNKKPNALRSRIAKLVAKHYQNHH